MHPFLQRPHLFYPLLAISAVYNFRSVLDYWVSILFVLSFCIAIHALSSPLYHSLCIFLRFLVFLYMVFFRTYLHANSFACAYVHTYFGFRGASK